MDNDKLFSLGGIGTLLSTAGTVLQTDEVLRIISLIVTIVGSIVSLIVIPLLNWYKNAKSDGKITVDEISDGINTLKNGIEELSDEIKEDK